MCCCCCWAEECTDLRHCYIDDVHGMRCGRLVFNSQLQQLCRVVTGEGAAGVPGGYSAVAGRLCVQQGIGMEHACVWLASHMLVFSNAWIGW
jgi:hypothetical protein